MENIKILIIDDEEQILSLLSMVTYDEGVELFFANSVEQALLLLPTVDGVISDIMMPDQDKLDVELEKVSKQIPVYRMSGAVDRKETVMIHKPFTIQEFKSMVVQLTKESLIKKGAL